MNRIVFISAGLAVIAVGAVVFLKTARERHARSVCSSTISSVIDTIREPGWGQRFEATDTQRLTTFDPRWQPIFGRLMVDSRLVALVGDPGDEDGGDDYAFRAVEVPTGSVEIVVDGWWNGSGAIGAEGAVQREPPHRLYEAALWQRKLWILYFRGPAPSQYETLAESQPLPVSRGCFRIVFHMVRQGGRWHLRATLERPARGETVASVSAIDGRLGEGAQGVGILSRGGGSYITGIAVRSLD